MANVRQPDDIDPRVLEVCKEDGQPYHEVGDRVQYLGSGEVGIVVKTWYNETLQCQDCYVVFDDWGNPNTRPEGTSPYMLRYTASSLFPIEHIQEPLDPWWNLDFEVSTRKKPHPASVYEGFQEWRETGKLSTNPSRTYRGIPVTKTEHHVVEYEEIVAFLLGEYEEIGSLPETKEACEEIITMIVQEEYGYPVYVHDKREEVLQLVQGFYTDFDNREW